jgi:hypothetical protein
MHPVTTFTSTMSITVYASVAQTSMCHDLLAAGYEERRVIITTVAYNERRIV